MQKIMVIVLSALLSIAISPCKAAPQRRPAEVPGLEQPAHIPRLEQINVTGKKPFDNLRLRIVMRFPANVANIQQATQYLLETTDYKLVLNPDAPDDARRILSRALLPQDRDDSLKTIEQALLQIAGEDTVLVIDKANKLISFEFLKNDE